MNGLSILPQMLEEWEERLFRTIDVLTSSRTLGLSRIIHRWRNAIHPPHSSLTGTSTNPRRLPMAPQSRQTLEFDPAILNATKLDVLHRHGVTHYSFGIQTLQAEVNFAHNRGRQSLRWLKEIEKFTSGTFTKFLRFSRWISGY